MSMTTTVRWFAVFTLCACFGCGSHNAGSTGSASDNANSAPAPAAAAPVQEAPPPVVVKSGTNVRVTIDQDVSSKDASEGDTIQASLAAPIVVGSTVVVPQGAKVAGRVITAKSAGRFKGNAELALTLTSIELSGKRYQIHTTNYTDAGKGRGKRTAEGAGIGAGAGALIGALTGGGKGAAIGAGAGAGAGVAGTALTGNRDVTVAAETKLDFRLTQSLELPAK